MSTDAREPDLVVVGAGAAGLWLAGSAAEAGLRVLVLEKTPRTGTKVLASGGTRCNLTTTLGPLEAAALFGRAGERFLRPAFQELPPLEVRRRFAEWGVPSDEAPLEKVFPRSGRARDVRDALEARVRAAGAALRLNTPVLGLQREGSAWVVSTPDGPVRAPRVALAAGGRSYPRTGTTGEGYRWLEDLGLRLRATSPALVPLTSPDPWVHDLSGIAWQEGAVRLLDASGRMLLRRERPLLFTHAGVSGPGAMDLSGPVGEAALNGAASFSLQLDLAPARSREETRQLLVEAGRATGAPRVSRALPERVPRRLLAALARQAGLPGPDPRVAHLSREHRHALVEAVHGLSLGIDGTRGFELAEVTRGGLDLKQVDPRSMRVNRLPGLLVVGELLDLDGPIGGLNFQAAFACAEVAARALAREVGA
ncbi:MAG: aminoacetone oxidase family FAD-binding enzyme [Planctomycetes bacterium]|nr:aminoacetone oxidase family FAD-binding enzyme [Planctomycetota bacterium]